MSEDLVNDKYLDEVYKAKSPDDIRNAYNLWSVTYENDVMKMGYCLTSVMTGFICRHIQSKESLILDAGCGTGLLGNNLRIIGYNKIHGIDISDGMLDQAKKYNAYRSLKQMTLGKPLDFPDQTFDAVISSGTLTLGHAPSSTFHELIRITKKEGIIVFSIRTDTDDKTGFKATQDFLQNEGLWDLVEQSLVFPSLPILEPEVLNQVFVYRIR